MQAASQKQRIFLARKVVGPRDDLRLQREHRADRYRQVAHRFQMGGFLLVAQAAFDLRQRERQQK